MSKSGTQSKTRTKVSKKAEKTPKKSKYVIDKTNNIKKKILEGLKEHNGNISKACENAGICRYTYYKYVEDEEFAKQCEEVQENQIDIVEDKLKERINGVSIYKGTDKDGNDIIYNVPPDTTAIIFYLKTKGKKRGYIERQEIEHSGLKPLEINVENTQQKKKIEDNL